MSRSHKGPRPHRSIRQLAESKLAGGAAVDIEKLTPDEIRVFVHELEVHRVELEVQNQQLAAAQLATEESKEGYRELYEAAPIGHLTLNTDGAIVAANLRAADLLSVPRARLVGRKLSSFVAEVHQDRWHFARRALEQKRDRSGCELTLLRDDGSPIEAQLIGWGRPGASGTLDLALLDVTSLRSAERALRRAASEASLGEQQERRKLASDLHDDVGQLLSLASLKVGALLDARESERDGQLRDLGLLLADARRRILSLSFELSPPLLHDVGLVAATRWLAEDLARRYALTVTVEKSAELDLDEATRVTLYRAIRELLINVARHAGIDRARVHIWRDGAMVRASVEDGGVGFDHDSTPSGFGLLALRERIAQLGGFIDFSSGAGSLGTRVVASLPLTSRERNSS